MSLFQLSLFQSLRTRSVLISAVASVSAITASALAALPAQELKSAPDPTDVRHSGHDVATYAGWTIASSEFESSANLPDGDLEYQGRLRLFQGTTFVRNYPLPVLCDGDNSGAGRKNTIALGASGIAVGYPSSDCEGEFDAGAVLVYDELGGDFATAPSVLAPPTPEVDANYGASVGMHGAWLVVGAPGIAAADLWKKEGSAWVRQGWLPVPATLSDSSNFGKDVAIHGDHLVVGAPSERKFFVYRYTHHAGWELTTESTDAFATGNAVDISNNTLVSSSGESQGGTVLIYGLHWDGSWVPQQEIQHEMFPGMPFGSDVAISDHRLIIGNDIEQRVALYGLQGGYVHLGNMQVNLPTSTGLYEFLSLGGAVDVDGDDVVAGDHDARYQSSTAVRGAVMHQKFYHVY